MSLTWKDLVTTILAAAVFGLYYAMSKGMALPIISGYRGAIIALAVIGIAMCAFSGTGDRSWTNPLVLVASILGVIALALIVYGLVTGAKVAFVWLSFTILVLWGIATFHHLITK